MILAVLFSTIGFLLPQLVPLLVVRLNFEPASLIKVWGWALMGKLGIMLLDVTRDRSKETLI
jgi:hypothetical protein